MAWLFLPLSAAATLVVMERIFWVIIRKRELREISEEAILHSSTSKKRATEPPRARESASGKHFLDNFTPDVAFRMLLSLVILVAALCVLIFWGEKHDWFQGANNVIGIVIGYWLPRGR